MDSNSSNDDEKTGNIGRDGSPDPPAGLNFNAIIPSSFGNEYELAYPYDTDERPRHINKLLPSHEKHKSKVFIRRHTAARIVLLERKLRGAANDCNWADVCKLIDDGVDPSCADSKGRTALHFAATHGNEDIVKTLISHNANLNAKDLNGNTPLHLAACSNQVKIVTLLLRGGTDINALDYTGRTPLDVAVSRLKMLHIDDSVRVVQSKYRDQVGQIIDMLKEYMCISGQKDEEKELDDLCKKLTETTTIEQVSMMHCFHQLKLQISAF